jgi:hypothetical protein
MQYRNKETEETLTAEQMIDQAVELYGSTENLQEHYEEVE